MLFWWWHSDGHAFNPASFLLVAHISRRPTYIFIGQFNTLMKTRAHLLTSYFTGYTIIFPPGAYQVNDFVTFVCLLMFCFHKRSISVITALSEGHMDGSAGGSISWSMCIYSRFVWHFYNQKVCTLITIIISDGSDGDDNSFGVGCVVVVCRILEHNNRKSCMRCNPVEARWDIEIGSGWWWW